MKIGTTIVIDRVDDVVKSVRALGTQRTLVGIPSSTAGRRDVPITNAAIGYIHEFGAPEENIPPRPFLIPGVASAMDRIRKMLGTAARQAVSGNRQALDRALHAIGLVAVSAVRKKITDGPFAPLAESTLASRRARGVTRTKPLIDTGQLRQGITYVIRRRGK